MLVSRWDATSKKLVGTGEHFQKEGLNKIIGFTPPLSTNPLVEEQLMRKV
jgi:hypothetical protein